MLVFHGILQDIINSILNTYMRCQFCFYIEYINQFRAQLQELFITFRKYESKLTRFHLRPSVKEGTCS